MTEFTDLNNIKVGGFVCFFFPRVSVCMSIAIQMCNANEFLEFH